MPCDPNFDINSQTSKGVNAASIATDSFQFAPKTPPLTKRLKNQLSAKYYEQEKGSNEGIDKCHDLVTSVDYTPKQHTSDELLYNILDSSFAVISTPSEEPKDFGKQIDQVIDLNQTPQQKTQKRKKHRPKVVREGKQNRTPKASTTKIADLNMKTTEKRKYVRKKGQQESPAQCPDSIGETTDSKETLNGRKNNVDHISERMNPSAGMAGPSCRRALNFDNLENIRDERESNSVSQQEIMRKKEAFNSSTGFQAAESVDKTNMMHRTISDLQLRQHNELLLENQESAAISNLTSSPSRLLCSNTSISHRTEAGAISVSDRREAAGLPASKKDAQMDNLNANARETDTRMQQHLHADPERTRQLMPQDTQSVGEIPHHLIHGRGNKRGFGNVEQTSHCSASPPDYDSNSCIFSAVCSETHKKMKIENGILTNTNGVLHSIAAVNYSIASTAQRNREIWNSYLNSKNIKRKENNGSTRYPVDYYTNLVASGQDLSMQQIFSGPNLYMERIAEAKATHVETLASLTTVEKYNLLPPTPKTGCQPEGQLQAKTSNIDVSMKQAMGNNQSKYASFREGKMLQEHADILKDQQSPAKRRGIDMAHYEIYL